MAQKSANLSMWFWVLLVLSPFQAAGYFLSSMYIEFVIRSLVVIIAGLLVLALSLFGRGLAFWYLRGDFKAYKAPMIAHFIMAGLVALVVVFAYLGEYMPYWLASILAGYSGLAPLCISAVGTIPTFMEFSAHAAVLDPQAAGMASWWKRLRWAMVPTNVGAWLGAAGVFRTIPFIGISVASLLVRMLLYLLSVKALRANSKALSADR